MIQLKNYIEAIEFKISEGSEYCWDCFGPNARYLDSFSDGQYSTSAIFDSKTQDVYSIELWDNINNREYRWINPMFVSAHMDACIKHGIDCYESLDGRNFIDLDLASDILEKISKMVAGEPYDSRVQIEVDFTEEELLQYMKIAHSRDMTFNQFVEDALRSEIARRKNENHSSV